MNVINAGGGDSQTTDVGTHYDTLEGCFEYLGDRPTYFPVKPQLSLKEVRTSTQEEWKEMQASKKEFHSAFILLQGYIRRLGALPHCLSVKNKGRALSCTCNQLIPQGHDFHSRYTVRQLTASAYSYSSTVSTYDKDMSLVRAIEARSEERGCRRFFWILSLDGIWFCKDTYSRIHGISDRQYRKCMNVANTIPLHMQKIILQGRKKLQTSKKWSTAKQQVNICLLAFFRKVSEEGIRYTKRGLYRKFLQEQGWQYEVDGKGRCRLLGCEYEPQMPVCSWEKFRTWWDEFLRRSSP